MVAKSDESTRRRGVPSEFDLVPPTLIAGSRVGLVGMIDESGRRSNDIEGGVPVRRSRLLNRVSGLVASPSELDVLALLRARVESLEREVTLLQESARRAARNERIAATMEWIRHVEVPAETLVSVVMCTRDRAPVLGRAIASVQAQSYPNWELVILDHGCQDKTPELLASQTDERLRIERFEGTHSEGLNRGVRLARGEVLAYLDDDNVMHPDWLRSVVWAFRDRPDVELLYGAAIVQYGHLDDGHEYNFMPHVNLLPWSRELLEHQAITDHGAVAHRAGLDDDHFVELPAARDWERMLRLTRTRDALALPAIALMYFEDGSERISDRTDYLAVQTAIAEAHGLPKPRPYLAGRRGLLLRVNELEKANAEHGALIERLRLERDSLVGGRERLNASAGLVVPEPRRSLPFAGLVRRVGSTVSSLGHSDT
jgi:hypothetical protein